MPRQSEMMLWIFHRSWASGSFRSFTIDRLSPSSIADISGKSFTNCRPERKAIASASSGSQGCNFRISPWIKAPLRSRIIEAAAHLFLAEPSTFLLKEFAGGGVHAAAVLFPKVLDWPFVVESRLAESGV